MEVRPGYKQTEVGIIPKEWEVKRLGECATFRTGPFGSALHKSDYTDDGVPVINPMHIVDGKIEPTQTMTVTEIDAKKLSDFRFKEGEIVIGRRGDMGRCAVIQADQAGWVCGTGSMIVRCERGAEATFLQRILSSSRAISAIEDASVGSTMINLNQGTLAGLRFQFPPTQEQHAIAMALSDVDSLLDGLDRLIAKKRDLKQAAMQQLLTAETRLPSFSDDWSNRRLGDGIELFSGQHVLVQHCNSVGIGTPYLTGPADFPNGTIQQTKFTDRPTTVCDPGDILVTVKGSGAGSLVVADRAYCISRQLMAIRAAKWCSTFVYYSLLQNATTIKEASAGLIPGLSRADILEQELPVPLERKEQTAIATVLSDMDAELAVLGERRDKTRALKQAMMQELLTGRTRLI